MNNLSDILTHKRLLDKRDMLRDGYSALSYPESLKSS